MLGASDVIFNYEVESFLVFRLDYRYQLSIVKACMLGKLFYSAKNRKNELVSVDSVVSGHVALVYPTIP